MTKKSTPSYVLELPLQCKGADSRKLAGLFEAGKRLNNVMLQHGMAVVDAMRADPAWGAARKLSAKSPEQKELRNERLRLCAKRTALVNSRSTKS